MPRTPRSPTTPLRARTIVLLLLLLAASQAVWAAGADAAAMSGSGGPKDWDERRLEGIARNGTDTHGRTVDVRTTPDADGTDTHGRTVTVRTTTDADGRYTITGSTQDAQDAGVHALPVGSRYTTPEDPAITRALDSDADPRTGRASVSLPDDLRAGDRLGVVG
jgi:hypothetical protein